jgi:hypothetical protein
MTGVRHFEENPSAWKDPRMNDTWIVASSAIAAVWGLAASWTLDGTHPLYAYVSVPLGLLILAALWLAEPMARPEPGFLAARFSMLFALVVGVTRLRRLEAVGLSLDSRDSWVFLACTLVFAIGAFASRPQSDRDAP